MTTPPGDDERFEHIPWELITPKGNQARLVLYAVAGAVLIAGLTAALVRAAGTPPALVATPAAGTSTTIGEQVTTPPEAASASTAPDPSTIAPDSAGENPRAWSEADLLAFPAESLAAEAGAVAEWLASDFFTVDGGTDITDDLERMLPEGSALPTARPGARSFVEWARATSVQETAPGLYQVQVVVRRLGAADGESYRRMPLTGVVITIAWTESGWSVIDLPALVEAPPLVQASAWSRTDVPAQVLSAVESGIGGEVLYGAQVGEAWRLVVAIEDSTGVSWPMVIWSDQAGNRLPASTQPVQP